MQNAHEIIENFKLCVLLQRYQLRPRVRVLSSSLSDLGGVMTAPPHPPAPSAIFLAPPLLSPASLPFGVVVTSRRPEAGHPLRQLRVLLRNRCNCRLSSITRKVSVSPPAAAAVVVTCLHHDPSMWSPLHTGSCSSSGCISRRRTTSLRSCRREREQGYEGRDGTTKHHHHGRLRGLAGRVLVLLQRLGGWSRDSARGNVGDTVVYSTTVELVGVGVGSRVGVRVELMLELEVELLFVSCSWSWSCRS